MDKQHHYKVQITWTGNDGEGTKTYKGYRRDHTIDAEGKPQIAASSDPHFRGDASRYNPEEFLVAALSSCHMLSYLHLCAVNHIVVRDYRDTASGVMELREDGSGAFTRATLRPRVAISRGGDQAKARELHHQAHHVCFIANSVNFPVDVEPEVVEEAAP